MPHLLKGTIREHYAHHDVHIFNEKTRSIRGIGAARKTVAKVVSNNKAGFITGSAIAAAACVAMLLLRRK